MSVCPGCVELEVGVVGGDHAPGTALVQLGEYGLGYRSTGRRFRARAEFVNQHEAVFIRFREHGVHIRKEGAVGAQVVFERLVVAYAHLNAVENRELRGFRGRDEHAPLEHVLQQPYGLQAYRLSSGVGSGDYDDSLLSVEAYGKRADFPVLLLQGLLQQGMARLAQMVFPGLGDDGHPRHEIQGGLRLCNQEIQLTHDLSHLQQGRDVGTQELAEGIEDTGDLPALGETQFIDFVLQLHHFGRLHEGGLARSRAVHHKARYPPLLGGVDRNQELARAHGDLRILIRYSVGLGP